MAFASQAKGFFAKGCVSGLESINAKAMKRFGTEENIKRLMRVKQLSEEKGVSPGALSLKYITENELQPLAIIGCSKVSQIEDTMSACTLTKEEADWLRNG